MDKSSTIDSTLDTHEIQIVILQNSAKKAQVNTNIDSESFHQLFDTSDEKDLDYGKSRATRAKAVGKQSVDAQNDMEKNFDETTIGAGEQLIDVDSESESDIIEKRKANMKSISYSRMRICDSHLVIMENIQSREYLPSRLLKVGKCI